MPDETTTTTTAERTVPYARFQKTAEERRAAIAEAATLREQLAAAEAAKAQAAELQAKLDEATAKHKAERAAWEESKAFLSNGIVDDVDADVVRVLYNRVPAETKPRTVADYLAHLRKVAAGEVEGETLPKAVAHLFTKATTTTTTEPETPAEPAPRPRPGHTGDPAGARGSASAAAVKAATAAFERNPTAENRLALQRLLGRAPAAS